MAEQDSKHMLFIRHCHSHGWVTLTASRRGTGGLGLQSQPSDSKQSKGGRGVLAYDWICLLIILINSYEYENFMFGTNSLAHFNIC